MTWKAPEKFGLLVGLKIARAVSDEFHLRGRNKFDFVAFTFWRPLFFSLFSFLFSLSLFSFLFLFFSLFF